MSTTEVFVEQVLIGLLVLAVVALVVVDPDVDLLAKMTGDWMQGLAAVAAAYLVGIVYDRVADTMLEDVERHRRLRFAIHRHGKDDPITADTPDPFPEDQLRVRLYSSEAGTAQWNYIRSRMRLTRAMATLVPALSFLWLLRFDGRQKERLTGMLFLAGLYVAGLLVRFAVSAFDGRIPKTNEPTKVEAYRKWVVKGWRGVLRHILGEPLTWIFFAWVVLSVVYASRIGKPGAWAIAASGTLLTFVCGWVWWRITGTFFRLLADHDRFAPKDG
jgi:hypothetical protein